MQKRFKTEKENFKVKTDIMNEEQNVQRRKCDELDQRLKMAKKSSDVRRISMT